MTLNTQIIDDAIKGVEYRIAEIAEEQIDLADEATAESAAKLSCSDKELEECKGRLNYYHALINRG